MGSKCTLLTILSYLENIYVNGSIEDMHSNIYTYIYIGNSLLMSPTIHMRNRVMFVNYSCNQYKYVIAYLVQQHVSTLL